MSCVGIRQTLKADADLRVWEVWKTSLPRLIKSMIKEMTFVDRDWILAAALRPRFRLSCDTFCDTSHTRRLSVCLYMPPKVWVSYNLVLLWVVFHCTLDKRSRRCHMLGKSMIQGFQLRVGWFLNPYFSGELSRIHVLEFSPRKTTFIISDQICKEASQIQ